MTSGIDLGIAGRRAIVCGSSAGLGYACAAALAGAGAEVVLNGRDAARLDAAADRLAADSGRRPLAVASDVTTAEGRAALVEVAGGGCDILVTNAGGPPPGDFREFDEEAWLAAFNTNAVSAIMLIRSLIDGMIARRWGRIINITSAAVKQPRSALPLSNTARSGLTAFAAGLARQVAEHGVTVNNLLPGSFATHRLRGYAERLARQKGTSLAEEIALMAAESPTGQIGDPADFGAWCAFFASDRAGYVTGQNLLLDGGAYPGML
ncbi:dehydrogenase [Sphingobium jiangsuense]|uniref:3-oxoacyl-[acyl-carrier protein] reductase n=1 Tax=Sphingobium jiangsuense TaxID=870476 RepID=A0A7W6BM84_9SPHN|nr:SDR family oxidoreductase [Sphingobium jiangsuense]MBB3928414.1 3-oxoacyl-[acyl-carrier protein] reductase [Sphingobium jiangsuense]GLS99793.1 dehydrogenase [Sphingobium jiangsuense]